MAKPLNESKHVEITSQVVTRFTSIERRLDLVYRYRKHVEASVRISQDQLDFVNGMMHPDSLVAFVALYESAITEAIEDASETGCPGRTP